MKKLLPLVVFLLIPFFNNSVIAVEAGKVGGRPANPDSENPRTESIFIINAEPGSEVIERLALVNNKDTAVTLKVYATDSAVANDGSFACEQYSEVDDIEGSWISIPSEEHFLEPNSVKEITFNITLPNNLEPGEYNGCIAIEEKKSNDTVGNGISINTRVGIRVAITIGGNIVKHLEFLDLRFEFREGRFYLIPVLKNDGNVSLDTSINMNIKTLGIFDSYHNEGTYPILRDTSSIFSFDFPKPFYGGFFLSDWAFTYDSDPNTTIGEPFAKPVTLKRSAWFFLFPEWWVFAGVALFTFGVIGMKIYYKRRGRLKSLEKTESGDYI